MPAKSAGAGPSDFAPPSKPINRSSDARHSAPSSTGIGSPARASVTMSESTSLAASSTSTTSDVDSMLPCRTASSTVSNTWANSTSNSKPKMPAPPLTECTPRKTACTVSSDPVPSRMSVRPVSISCNSSLHSSKKVRLSSSKFVMMPKPSVRGRRALWRDLANGRDQPLRIERLDHPSGGSRLAGEILLFGVAFGGQHEDRRRLVHRALAQAADHLVAVPLRHVDVGDDDVHPLVAQHVDAVLPVNRLQYLEAGMRQREHEHVAHGLGVVDRQDFLGHGTLISLRFVCVVAFVSFLLPGEAEIGKGAGEPDRWNLDRHLVVSSDRREDDLDAGQRQRLDLGSVETQRLSGRQPLVKHGQQTLGRGEVEHRRQFHRSFQFGRRAHTQASLLRNSPYPHGCSCPRLTPPLPICLARRTHR